MNYLNKQGKIVLIFSFIRDFYHDTENRGLINIWGYVVITL